MAAADRKTADRLAPLEALRERPWDFDFFNALRILECAYPDRPRVGESVRVHEDAFRLAQEPSSAFAPSTMSAFEPGADGGPARLSVLFLGLFGPNGPLPLHLTEYARDRLRNHRDPAFSRFVDVFHHRMLSCFYRAWARAQPVVQMDRPSTDRFALYVGSLIGLGLASLRDRDALPDHLRFHFAGRLSTPARNPEGLEAMLGGFFRVPARVEEFVGSWVDLPESAWTRLGGGPDRSALGVTSFAGTRIRDCAMKFRIVLGPVDVGFFRGMLPGSSSLERLVGIVRSFTGDEMLWDLNVILRREDVPGTRLGGRSHLGWTTWVLSDGARRDADDLVLDPVAHARRRRTARAPEPAGVGAAT